VRLGKAVLTQCTACLDRLQSLAKSSGEGASHAGGRWFKSTASNKAISVTQRATNSWCIVATPTWQTTSPRRVFADGRLFTVDRFCGGRRCVTDRRITPRTTADVETAVWWPPQSEAGSRLLLRPRHPALPAPTTAPTTRDTLRDLLRLLATPGDGTMNHQMENTHKNGHER